MSGEAFRGQTSRRPRSRGTVDIFRLVKKREIAGGRAVKQCDPSHAAIEIAGAARLAAREGRNFAHRQTLPTLIKQRRAHANQPGAAAVVLRMSSRR